MLKSKQGYTRLRAWLNEYGKSGMTDKEAMKAFLEVENPETINSLRAELMAVSRGEYEEKVFDVLVGRARKARYGSYQQWGKLMLQWMASQRM